MASAALTFGMGMDSSFKMAVVGKSIGYSKSPFIHGEFAKALGLSVDYTIQDVGEGSFADTIARLRSEGFNGCNITVPYKEDAFKMADVKSPRAEQAGAANTFSFKEEHIFADNTDGIGFIRDVTRNIGIALAGKRILICGAGGAVRGILGPLLAESPASVTIANRTFDKGIGLRDAFSSRGSVTACTYEKLAGQIFDVIIDGTSLKTERLPIPDSLSLAEGALVYDLKYNPGAPTSIMSWGREKGAAQIHDGIGMLVEQAAEAFNIWTGRTPDTAPVIAGLKATYASSAPSATK